MIDRERDNKRSSSAVISFTTAALDSFEAVSNVGVVTTETETFAGAHASDSHCTRVMSLAVRFDTVCVVLFNVYVSVYL